MKHRIDYIDKFEYNKVVELWEASVRATHHFLKEEDITYFKSLILNTYLDAVELRCCRDEYYNIIGFVGVLNGHLEMLFIHPAHRGKSIGKTLLEYAISNLKVTKVDVNKQNNDAIGFYKRYGFKAIGRSETDASGKPYPILHLELIKI
ncbi:GNAT family N-acetyltransferase [Aureisphaera sp. CAU 1614]|uniref:GNAT family N-acetyltransferase n=1 Tax=Halomarinibacterium sedimenti TaxID=2857106 RepID=A0A9X1FN91_9FLAO|nr:GNAT family N-acetyltransferase [Halomarinibacterium sedimenti]MBW2936777.1 GNAT family N-acetyltransferase [Halomarinibacterium sedimenti]